MAARTAVLLLAALAPAAVFGDGNNQISDLWTSLLIDRQAEDGAANPIRRVVTMLQTMQQKVEAEGEKEKALFDKFMCYCKNSGGDLQKSIADANTKVPTLGADIESSSAKKKQLQEDLKQHQMDRSAAKSAMADATAIREKEAKEYAKESASSKTNIAALGGAIKSIEGGMAGGFLQTRGAMILRRLIQKRDMMEADRDDIAAFLDGTSTSGYVPQSGQITGILKEMHDEMSKDLADTIAAEKSAIESFDGLISAKTKEVNALTKGIETKTVKVGELSVSIIQMKNDLGDTEAALLEDQKFLADMEKNCATKSKEWDLRTKTRNEELLALADTIKILNDDDALELFKKTLPGASSFVQIRDTSDMREQALKILSQIRRSHGGDPRLDFLTLCMQGKKIGFEKVIKMVDDMVAELKKEQLDDDKKKEYCNKQFDLSDDKKKVLEQKISDLETSMESAEDGIATAKSEIKALQDGIKKLDRSVNEASEQRKQEHEDFTELMASNSAAKEILKFAINRLNKFYNPKMYQPPPKAAMTQLHAGERPPPPPETFSGEYQSKGEESNGVMAMINLLVKDLDKEMTEAETAEEDSQKDYEQLMKDSADKRNDAKKSLTNKEGAKAAMQGELEQSKEDKKSASSELMATKQYIGTLHAECDWLIQYFDVRKNARSDEIDALGKAKAVLSGADYSLVQKRSTRHLRSHF